MLFLQLLFRSIKIVRSQRSLAHTIELLPIDWLLQMLLNGTDLYTVARKSWYKRNGGDSVAQDQSK